LGWVGPEDYQNISNHVLLPQIISDAGLDVLFARGSQDQGCAVWRNRWGASLTCINVATAEIAALCCRRPLRLRSCATWSGGLCDKRNDRRREDSRAKYKHSDEDNDRITLHDRAEDMIQRNAQQKSP
jgi:hypothetical protein